jgi:hypothetical protein
MKNITIEVPRSGTAVKLVLRAGASTGQAIIVASDDVEILLMEAAPPVPARPKSPPSTSNGKVPTPKTPSHDLDAILKRLLKLKPTKRAAAVNSIRAMFQFDSPISEETANKFLEEICRRGDLTIDANNKIRFCNAS